MAPRERHRVKQVRLHETIPARRHEHPQAAGPSLPPANLREGSWDPRTRHLRLQLEIP